MRKFTVLLLAGALLAVTGGASVARAGDFAILSCFQFGGAADPQGLTVAIANTSFARPAECSEPEATSSCAACAAAIMQRGLKSVETNLAASGPNLPPQGILLMVFTGDDDDDDDDDD